MELDLALFSESLKIMGLGMIGIFIVTAVIIGAMYALTKVFPYKDE